MFQCYLVVSGSGEVRYFGYPRRTLKECEEEIKRLDVAFSAWEDAQFPELPDDKLPLRAYEGCDIYAVQGDQHFEYSDDGWRQL